LCIHIQLTICIINSDLCKIQLMPDLLDHYYCTHWGPYVPRMHAYTHTLLCACKHLFVVYLGPTILSVAQNDRITSAQGFWKDIEGGNYATNWSIIILEFAQKDQRKPRKI
jgi:hypothetical protein